MTAPDPTEAGSRPTHPTRGVWGDGIRGVGGIDDLRAGLSGVLRGLSALFWGLPLALLAFARHFLAVIPTLYDLFLPTLAAGLVLFGLLRMAPYQRGERVWQNALLVAQMLALLVVGLSPFLFLWSRMPSIEFFARAVALLLGVALVFLVALLGTLERLAAMMPDDTVRGDAQLFRGLTAYVVSVLAGVFVTLYWRLAPGHLSEFLEIPKHPLGFGRQAILLLLILVPVAMAMAVTWKLKEVVLATVLGGRGTLSQPPGPPTGSASGSGANATGSRSG